MRIIIYKWLNLCLCSFIRQTLDGPVSLGFLEVLGFVMEEARPLTALLFSGDRKERLNTYYVTHLKLSFQEKFCYPHLPCWCWRCFKQYSLGKKHTKITLQSNQNKYNSSSELSLSWLNVDVSSDTNSTAAGYHNILPVMLDWPIYFPFKILNHLSSFLNSTWIVVRLPAPFDFTPSSGTLFLTLATYLKQINRVTQL